MSALGPAHAAEAEALRPQLWRLAYHMTGLGAEADDLVQDCLLTLLERPPADLDRPLRPWLTRVLVHRARDRLRARQRRPYVGPWLPEPLEPRPDPEARAEQREALSYAWMVAAERLSPLQRAVLLLREVEGHSVAEVAGLLGVSEVNVKVSLHRARQRMAAQAPAQPRSEEALHAFAQALAALSSGDLGALGGLASPALELVNDGGGRVHAARVRILGLERVARVSERLQRRRRGQWEMELGWLSDCPALRYRVRGGRRGEPDAGVIIGLMSGGQLLALWTVLNPEKLHRAELPPWP